MSTNTSISKFFRNGKEPVFAAPWEAHAFALTVKLYEQGLFSWVEWSNSLGEAIATNAEAPYYESWLEALESLVLEKGVIEAQELMLGIASLKSNH